MKRKWLRPLLLIAVIAGLVVLGRLTGWSDEFTVDRVRSTMRAAGLVGFLIFLVVFSVGQLLYIPGFVFVAAAALAYGPVVGAAASMVAALISISVSFFVVRTIGGQPLSDIEHPWFRRPFARLERQPVRSMILIRLFFWSLPPVNYALAMSSVRFRDYFVAAVIGLTPPFVTLSFLFDAGFELL